MNHHLIKPVVESPQPDPPRVVSSPLGKALGLVGASILIINGVMMMSGEGSMLVSFIGLGLALGGRMLPKQPRAC